MTGKITRVFPDRGFGFIAADDGHDYFVHYSALLDKMRFEDVRPGMVVTFGLVEGPRGPRAANVRIAPHRYDGSRPATTLNASV
jgi:CspA family cold shock protein